MATARPRRRARPIFALLTSALLGLTLLAGCGPSGEGAGDRTLTVWSLENQTDRVRATRAIVNRFTRETGIRVKLVAVEENQFSQLLMTSAAAGELPDVIGALPLTGTWQMGANELVDTAANASVVRSLGEETFADRALELTRNRGAQLAVPSDGWVQLIAYRKDLFEQAGLAPPNTYRRIRHAAEVLDDGKRSGITLATDPSDAFTTQTFEYLALANGCELVDHRGRITVDSPECERAFRLVQDLTHKYSPAGLQDVDSTRATYFAGRSAMVVWSSYLLDELAGLRKDAMPSCPRCAGNPEFLADNSGIVTKLRGPDASAPTQFGEVTSWTITSEAATGRAKRFVEFMMSEGYSEWIGIAPEGKFPARHGTRQNPRAFSDAWYASPAGVDVKKPLSEIYAPRTVRSLNLDSIRRWGFPQGKGVLMGSTMGELPVSQAISTLAGGGLDATEAAERVADDVRSIQNSVN